jgi:hypothetical protein
MEAALHSTIQKFLLYILLISGNRPLKIRKIVQFYRKIVVFLKVCPEATER